MKHHRRHAQKPMLVVRQMNMDLEIMERMAVQAMALGAATTFHYDMLLHMQGLMFVAGHQLGSREIIKYADEDVGSALVGIKERFERTGRVECSGYELSVLISFVNRHCEFWVRQPITLFAQCAAVMKAHFARVQAEAA